MKKCMKNLIVFKNEDYKYFDRFNKAFPFEFKTFENTYIKSDDILDKISDKRNSNILFR